MVISQKKRERERERDVNADKAEATLQYELFMSVLDEKLRGIKHCGDFSWKIMMRRNREGLKFSMIIIFCSHFFLLSLIMRFRAHSTNYFFTL